MNQAPTQVDYSNLPFNYVQRGQDWVEGSNAHEQSPIDINTEQTLASNDKMKFELFLNDQEIKELTILDTINSIQVVGPFSKLYGMDVDGQTYEYEAVQFHFHAPSEHTINDGHYDLEMHIVHQITPDCFARTKTHRNLAVVGIFFQVDESANTQDHPFLTVLEKPHPDEEFSMNFNEVLKDDLKDMMTYYAYKGSLTVPPCSANANWFVIEKPIKITRHQQEYFDFRWKDNPYYAGGHGNNRPVQPLAGRSILKSTSCCIKGMTHESERKLYLEKPALIEETRAHTADEGRVSVEHKPEATNLSQGDKSRSGSVYSNSSRQGSFNSKDIPRELARIGSVYQRQVSKSLHSKEVPKEVLLLRDAVHSNEDKLKDGAPTRIGLSRFGSVHAKLGSHEGKYESPEPGQRLDKKSDSLYSKDSHEDRPIIRESIYSKGTSSRHENIFHVDEIPLDLLKFGSCFPSDDTPISRGSQHSRGFAQETHFLENEVNSPSLPTRSGQTLYSKDAPAEIAEMLKNGLTLDDEDDK